MESLDQTWVLGDLYTFHLSTQELAVLEVETRAHLGPPLHSHANEDESFYVLEGELEVVHNGETRKVVPGDFIHLPKGTFHTFRNTAENGSRLLVLLRPGTFANLFRTIGITDAQQAQNPETLRQSQEKLLSVAPEYGLQIEVPD